MIEITPSEVVAEKALRLYQAGAVYIGKLPDGRHAASVRGDSEWHRVIATPAGLVCDCRAWAPSRLCSHATASALAWADDASTSGRPPTAAGGAGPGKPATAAAANLDPPAAAAADYPQDAA
jgi:hypothetical protein